MEIYVDRDQTRKTNDRVENIKKIWKFDEIKLGWQGGARVGYRPARGGILLLVVAGKHGIIASF